MTWRIVTARALPDERGRLAPADILGVVPEVEGRTAADAMSYASGFLASPDIRYVGIFASG